MSLPSDDPTVNSLNERLRRMLNIDEYMRIILILTLRITHLIMKLVVRDINY